MALTSQLLLSWLHIPAAPVLAYTSRFLQTDGWLSEKSASIYEASTETLFLGRQDAMQRQSLVPLHSFMQGRGQDGAGTQMLEVACGTGRFATFVKVRVEALCGRGLVGCLHGWLGVWRGGCMHTGVGSLVAHSDRVVGGEGGVVPALVGSFWLGVAGV